MHGTFIATRRYICVLAFSAAASAVLLGSAGARAQEAGFPDRPLKIILMFPAGNGLDTSTRNFADALSKDLKQPVVVENRPGANGTIAFSAARMAPADGYTLLVGSSSGMTIPIAFGRSLPYDPFKDFKIVGGMLRAQAILTVPADSRITSMRDLVEVAKARPDPITIGTYSDGYYLTSQRLAKMAGIRLQNVPYKGYPTVLPDLVAGRIDMAYGDATATQELIKTGKIRPVAVTGTSRHVNYPDVPTVAESGFPDFSYYSWDVFLVRSETPAPITEKLKAAVRRVLNGRDYPASLRANGSEPMLDDLPAIQRMIAEEVTLYKSLIASLPKRE
ncbi:tripartite-type tricarboxylate transporter receptor subunit TctC [Cupriavidus gilardii J11]|uniref:Tripartite-type tricarboxylate transporter receptor subunit TctC n=1 Tax=Cupriavidus gilardii J11 TaxID=936133 RepID=A0A562B1L0_9BURK|nr:tripartite tricarboxylate transporter substrate binding protein [Cupriavidus gilardii]TWG79026.1 tripartite-type tricarboxylate transporter receptor subunit TctC [Cupriavidus gilardii J11]